MAWRRSGHEALLRALCMLCMLSSSIHKCSVIARSKARQQLILVLNKGASAEKKTSTPRLPLAPLAHHPPPRNNNYSKNARLAPPPPTRTHLSVSFIHFLAPR